MKLFIGLTLLFSYASTSAVKNEGLIVGSEPLDIIRLHKRGPPPDVRKKRVIDFTGSRISSQSQLVFREDNHDIFVSLSEPDGDVSLGRSQFQLSILNRDARFGNGIRVAETRSGYINEVIPQNGEGVLYRSEYAVNDEPLDVYLTFSDYIVLVTMKFDKRSLNGKKLAIRTQRTSTTLAEDQQRQEQQRIQVSDRRQQPSRQQTQQYTVDLTGNDFYQNPKVFAKNGHSVYVHVSDSDKVYDSQVLLKVKNINDRLSNYVYISPTEYGSKRHAVKECINPNEQDYEIFKIYNGSDGEFRVVIPYKSQGSLVLKFDRGSVAGRELLIKLKAY
jgi:hypothetical protein